MGQPGYTARADLTGDGQITLADQTAVLTNFGSSDAPGLIAGPRHVAAAGSGPPGPGSNGESGTRLDAPLGVGLGSGRVIGYAGAVYDPATGLSLMRRRWYDPREGRFITRDPLGHVDGSSLYLYALANPNGYVDPSGLFARQYEDRNIHYEVRGSQVYKVWDTYRTGWFGFGGFDYHGTREELADSTIPSDVNPDGTLKEGVDTDAAKLRETHRQVIQQGANQIAEEAGNQVIGGAAGTVGGKVGGAAARAAKRLAKPFRELTEAEIGAARKALRTFFEKQGKIDKNCASRQAHHIIPLADPRAKDVRRLMHDLGIDITHVDYGIPLDSEFHRGVHTKDYYDRLREHFKDITKKDHAIEKIKKFGEQLRKENDEFVKRRATPTGTPE